MIRSLLSPCRSSTRGRGRPAQGSRPGFQVRRASIGDGFRAPAIAYVTALAGIDVVLIDCDQAAATAAARRHAKL